MKGSFKQVGKGVKTIIRLIVLEENDCFYAVLGLDDVIKMFPEINSKRNLFRWHHQEIPCHDVIKQVMHIHEALKISFFLNFSHNLQSRKGRNFKKTIFNLFRVFRHFLKWQADKTVLKCNVKLKEVKKTLCMVISCTP